MLVEVSHRALFQPMGLQPVPSGCGAAPQLPLWELQALSLQNSLSDSQLWSETKALACGVQSPAVFCLPGCQGAQRTWPGQAAVRTTAGYLKSQRSTEMRRSHPKEETPSSPTSLNQLKSPAIDSNASNSIWLFLHLSAFEIG